MRDIQQEVDLRNIPLKHVGITRYQKPIYIEEDGSHTVATFELYTDLSKENRGTHMSRLSAVLENISSFSLASQQHAIASTLAVLPAKHARLVTTFDWFYVQYSPKSHIASHLPARITLVTNETGTHTLTLTVQATTVCPCSKAISEYGAHNQRAHLTIEGLVHGPILPLIEKLKSQASCEIFGVLKRIDEKYITEYAYDNAKFVEDVVRDIVLAFNTHPTFTLHKAVCENDESIHAHNAVAVWEKP